MGDDKERGYAEMTSPGIAGVRTGEDASAPRNCGAKIPVSAPAARPPFRLAFDGRMAYDWQP